MLHSRIVWVAGISLALILGLALAYPLLISQMPPIAYEELGIDVVYAYFGEPSFDPNIIGLWRNYTNRDPVLINGARWGFDVHVTAYFLVLNITNYSAEPVYIRSIEAMVGPQIEVMNQGSISAQNLILHAHRNTEYVYGWNELWSANASRLIYLSGIIGVHDLAYNSFESTICLYGKVEGKWDNYFRGENFKQVQFENLNGAYLYNTILREDQMFVFYQDLDVAIGTRD